MDSSSRTWSYSGPSYIKTENFATAMINVLQKVPGDLTQIQASIDALPDPQLKQLFGGMLARAKGDVDHLHKQIADWFDTAMDRVSGAYKRQAQVISFLAALVLAVSINVDATHAVTTLWRNPVLAREVANQVHPPAQGSTSATTAMEQLMALPVGPDALVACSAEALLCVGKHGISGYNLLGWLITAVAAVFGAAVLV